MNISKIKCRASLVSLVVTLTVIVSCHVHAPDEARYHVARVEEENILHSLLSDQAHLEEHDGQRLVKVSQPQDMAASGLDMDALATTDPLVIAAKYPLASSDCSYFTPLMYAVSVQDMSAVRGILAVYDAVNEDHKLEKIQFAIPSGIHNTSPKNAGHTALLLGIISQNVDMVRVLVENGAPVNMHFTQAVGELGGSTPIHVGTATQDPLVLEAMLAGASQRVNLEIQDAKNQSTPLDLGLSRSYMGTVKCLLKYGANPNSVDRTLGWRPLARPILNKDLAMVELLLSYGASPYLENHDVEGTPWLYRALVQACTIRLELVRLLFDHVINDAVRDTHGTEIETDINFQFNGGLTSLHVAVLQRDLELVRLILDLGSDVDPTDAVGSTPLHMAIAAHSHPIVELLLRYGADIGICDGNGKSPLERAAELNQVGIIKALLTQGGAKHVTNRYIDTYLPLLDEPSRNELNAHLQYLSDPGGLQKFRQIRDQLRQDDYRTYHTSALLDRLATDYVSALDNAVSPGAKTVLYWAAIRREPVLFRSLINMGANINAVISPQGHTLLHHVIVEQHDLALIEEILSYPAVNVNQRMSQSGYTPLHLTVIQGFDLSDDLYNNLLYILRRFLAFRKTNVNAKNRDGDTALHFAIVLDRPDMAKEILGHRLVKLNIRNKKGEAPLHKVLRQAIEHNNVPEGNNALYCFKLLLTHPQTDVNLKNKHGSTPLHMAVSAARPDLVQILLTHPGIDLNIEDNHGSAPLHRAVEAQFLSLVQQLLRDDRTHVNVQDKLGNTPLHLAAPANMSAITKALMEHHAIQPNIQNLEGDAPIHSVIWRGAVDTLALLVSDERVNLHLRDLAGHSPLHLAICYGDVHKRQHAIETLLRAPRFDLSTSEADGDRFLDLARQYNCGETITAMLLERMEIT